MLHCVVLRASKKGITVCLGISWYRARKLHSYLYELIV